jgi:NodT family efflux transporter outer membrane factor (OMF) lipoprotein
MIRQTRRYRWSLPWGAVAASLWIAGCAVGPDFVRPQPPGVERYTTDPLPSTTIAADGQTQRFDPTARVGAAWWQLFGSPAIDAVLAEAFANNATVQAAEASLRASQDNLRAGYGIFFPTAQAAFDYTREKPSTAISTPTPAPAHAPAPTAFNLFTLSGTVSYALDIFGGQRRTVERLGTDTAAQQYTTVGAYLALSGNVVDAVIARAGYPAQIDATLDIIAIQTDQVQITRAQANAGLVQYSNLLSLESQLAATQATLPPLRQRLSQTEHLLASLVGRAPAEWRAPPVGLDDLALPRDLPVSLPAELVRQRPDILVAEAQLQSASAAIGVATAALFPSLSFGGSAQLSRQTLSTLLKAASASWSFGATVTTPVLQGPTLWFQRKAAIDTYDGARATYRQTVISGLVQVADTLRAIEHDAETLEAQSRAVEAARDALHLIRINYEAGRANYLDVLVSNTQYQQARLGYLQARAQRLQDTVALFVALGGGWWNAPGALKTAAAR